MKMKKYIDEILLKLGGGVVKIELEDNKIVKKIVQAAFRELQRYIDVIKYETVPYSSCIDLSKLKVHSVTQVLRATTMASGNYEMADALYLSLSSFNGSLNDMSAYRSYLLTRQLKNTLKTDLAFRWDELAKKLYVSTTYPQPDAITIVYIPRFDTVEELDSPYWEDMLLRLSLALCKETLGRIRGKYRLENALYSLDADQLLEEGRTELEAIREHLQANSDLNLPID